MLHKVLYDVSLGAQASYAGIPQDTRLIFRALAQIPSIDLTGLIMETGGDYTRGIARRWRSKSKSHYRFHDAAEYIAELDISRHSSPHNHLALRILRKAIYFPRKDVVKSFPEKIFQEVIWRVLLAKSLPSSDRKYLEGVKFVYSTLTVHAIIDAIFSIGPRARLDTGGYEFAIFQDVRAVRVSPGTIKICRYHDAIPITHADTQSSAWSGNIHFRAIDMSRNDSYWVCNSEGTRQELLSLFPALETRAFVIPCAVLEPDPFSAKILPAQILNQTAKKAFSIRTGKKKKPLRYIMAVSTLEPRKNYPGIIGAWESITATDDPDLKLVIVGSPGWKNEDIVKAIEQRVKSRNLIHLKNLTTAELQALYRGAEAVVFPSFAEGFGYAPVEALACSTPSVVSDTPNSRWVMEDSAIYVDPYDVKDIANGIRKLTTANDREKTKRALLKNRDRILKRYSINTIAAQWEDLFAELKKKQNLI